MFFKLTANRPHPSPEASLCLVVHTLCQPAHGASTHVRQTNRHSVGYIVNITPAACTFPGRYFPALDWVDLVTATIFIFPVRPAVVFNTRHPRHLWRESVVLANLATGTVLSEPGSGISVTVAVSLYLFLCSQLVSYLTDIKEMLAVFWPVHRLYVLSKSGTPVVL